MTWFSRLFSGKKEKAPPPPLPPAPPPPPASPEIRLPRFPFPVVPVPGADAVAEWRRFHEAWRKEGSSAVMVGDEDDVMVRADTIAESAGMAEDALAMSWPRTPEGFFARRRLECKAEEDYNRTDPWPELATPTSEVTAHLDVLSRKPKELVYIAKLPTAKPWEIPAYLMAGGWNDCPTPEDQVTAFRYWTPKYGVEVYALTGDVMECFVTNPPRTEADALALAREQFLFCTDLVYQGTETITRLAGTLKDATTWYFWWD